MTTEVHQKSFKAFIYGYFLFTKSYQSSLNAPTETGTITGTGGTHGRKTFIRVSMQKR
jgi:hypothetical protein